MLVSCPKCGFSQPKDRYCASCGVDMDAFGPKRSSFARSFISHPAVFVTLAVAVVVATVYYVRLKRVEELNQINSFRSASSGQVTKSLGEASNGSSPEAAPNVSADTSNVPPSPPPQNATADAGQDTRTSAMNIASETSNREASAPPTDAAPARNSDQQKLLVKYYELDRKSLSQLLALRESALDQDDVRSGPIPSAKQLLKQMRGLNELQSIDKKFDPTHLEQRWFIGHRGGGGEQDIGLSVTVALGAIENARMSGDILIQRSFRESVENPAPVRKNMQLAFELVPGKAWMIHFPLPRIAQEDEEVSTPGFMSLFRSDKFKKRETEFTMILEFDTTSSQRDSRNPNSLNEDSY